MKGTVFKINQVGIVLALIYYLIKTKGHKLKILKKG
jgi:hypothetical protein